MTHLREISYTEELKGLAILAVVILHILSNLSSAFVTDPNHLPIILAIDQIGRFCVPLFVAISGFGLMRKYMVKKFELVDFIKRRVFRLLPLYLLWVTISLVVFRFSPAWNWMGSDLSLLLKIGLGRADYHLYYVPMIIQLYLFFPILYFLIKKYPASMVMTTALIQGGLYWFYTLVFSGTLHPSFRLTDQREYVTSFSWIFYFVLGMYLAQRLDRKKTPLWQFVALVAFGVGLVWSTMTGQKALPGTDTIQILRFTRMPVFLFATGAIVLSLSHIPHFKSGIWRILQFMGKHSYLIYLAHPLILRVISGAYLGTADLQSLLVASVGITVALFLSISFHLE